MYLHVSYNSHNKQRLFPYTTPISSLYEAVFSERYEINLYTSLTRPWSSKWLKTVSWSPLKTKRKQSSDTDHPPTPADSPRAGHPPVEAADGHVTWSGVLWSSPGRPGIASPESPRRLFRSGPHRWYTLHSTARPTARRRASTSGAKRRRLRRDERPETELCRRFTKSGRDKCYSKCTGDWN